jgi:hypothetical protein
MAKIKPAVRIIAIPPGEAPLWVREKWVGLELPLARTSPGRFLGFGALSGPRTFLAQLWGILRGRADRIYGFAVDAGPAVELLEASSPEAAAWWRDNAGELVSSRRCLLFHADVCQVVPK